MKSMLLVGIGGFAGSVLRFRVGAYLLHLHPSGTFPWATLAVNLIGCFAAGMIAEALERTTFHNAELRLMLITGFLGGFTTFSAFGLETYYLLRQELFAQASLNILCSVIFGVAAFGVGLRCGTSLFKLAV